MGRTKTRVGLDADEARKLAALREICLQSAVVEMKAVTIRRRAQTSLPPNLAVRTAVCTVIEAVVPVLRIRMTDWYPTTQVVRRPLAERQRSMSPHTF